MNKKLTIYKKYFKEILEHKKNVFKVCWNEGLYIHAFTHDLSKFSPFEFFAYANWFHGDYGKNWKKNDNAVLGKLYHKEAKAKFLKAWQHHKDINKHHQHYWYERNLEMPNKYIDQMICDWKAMSMRFGDTPQEYYMSNYYNIEFIERNYLYSATRVAVEAKLGLHDYGLPICQSDFWYFCTIDEALKNAEQTIERNGNIAGFKSAKDFIDNELFEPVVEKLGFSLYDKLRPKENE